MEGFMRFLGLCLLLLSLPTLASIRLTTQISDIDYGKNANDQVLVFLSSGHVGKLIKSEKGLITHLTEAKNSQESFTITMSDERFIQGIENAPSLARKLERSTLAKSIQDYIPTTVVSMSKAKSYFREQKHPAKEETQCFNRAMVWTYEWWKNHSLKSNKLLIFFSRNYIRRYDFEWWFHISPYLHIQDNGKVVERVMDAKYTGGPLEMRKWSNIFMRNDAECPMITKYSEYAENPYSGECFLYRTNMYTYQPADLQMYEAWGYSKDAFNMDEVKGAYLEAFTAPTETEGDGNDEGSTTGSTTGGTTGGTF
jgi:hypothetical protein